MITNTVTIYLLLKMVGMFFLLVIILSSVQAKTMLLLSVLPIQIIPTKAVI